MTKSERDREYYVKHREEILARVKKYAASRTEAIAEYSLGWRRRNKEYLKDKRAEYHRIHTAPGCTTKANRASGGRAAELLVEADLLMRGLHVTRPSNPDSPDDLHARLKRGWTTFQVKATPTNMKTGTVAVPSSWNISSDVVVLVTQRGSCIQYVPAALKRLPRELR